MTTKDVLALALEALVIADNMQNFGKAYSCEALLEGAAKIQVAITAIKQSQRPTDRDIAGENQQSTNEQAQQAQEPELQGAGVIRYRKHYPSGPNDGTRRLGGWSYIDASQAEFYAAALAGADCVERFEPSANPQATHLAPKQAEK
jgi:hypothetical protein